MINREPDPKCPDCQGAGIVGQHWDSKAGEFVTDPEPSPCPLCYKGYREIYAAAAELLNQFSGKARHLKNMSADEVEAVWKGEEGQRYRRLLRWLWTPENIPAAGTAYSSPTTPFKELFAYEARYERPGPQPKPKRELELKPEPVTMEAQLDAKDLTRALKNVLPVIGRRSRIPILSDVKITARNGDILITGTNLDEWKEERIPAVVKVEGSCCLPAHRLFELAKLHRGDMYFISHDDCEAEILTASTYYIMIGLPVDNYPAQRAAA